MGKRLQKFFILCILAMFLCVLAGCTAKEVMQNDGKVHVRLILKYLTRDYRDEIISGAKTAANEYGMDIIIQSLNPGEDPAIQAEMMNNALKSDADAIILAAEQSDAIATAISNAKKTGTPIILIDTDWGKENAFCSIGTDNDQMSRDVAEQLHRVAGNKCSVYLLNSICPAGKTGDKEMLLTAELEKYNEIHVEPIDYNTEFQDELKNTLKLRLNELRYNQVIIALDGFSSSAAILAIKESNRAIHLIAFGNSLDLVSEMENGRVDAMVVENAFTKGYMAVQNAMSAIKKDAKPEDISLKARIVTLDNLYLPENQKLIFPLT